MERELGLEAIRKRQEKRRNPWKAAAGKTLIEILSEPTDNPVADIDALLDEIGRLEALIVGLFYRQHEIQEVRSAGRLIAPTHHNI